MHATTPGTDDQGGRAEDATFIWDDAQAERVHLTMNRVTDKADYERGLMHRVPGTDTWTLTLRLPTALRASYGFTPLQAGEQTPQGPPLITRTFWDPRNPDPPLRRQGPHGTSIHTGSEAPPQPEWRTGRGPLERHVGERIEGRIVEDSLEVPRGSGPRRHLLYLPAPDAQEQSVSTSGLPLLVLFDAEVWFDELGLPHALEAAVRAGRRPPLAVLGVTTSGRADRFRSLGANSAFLAGVAETSIPWAERAAVAQGIRLAGRDRRILAGQSLGGLSALVGALELPEAFGAVLAHSASLWWEHQEAGPEGFMPAPPRFDREPGNNWITARFREASARDVRIRLEVGTREGPAAAHNRALHRVLLERGWESEQHLYEGGHDWACWRGCLIDGLDWALSPPTPAE